MGGFFLAQSEERLTAEREVVGSILGAEPILRVLRITMKVLPLHCKLINLCVARMTS